MLARVVEVTIKGGKKHDVINILQNELIPFLQKQAGFVAHETMSRQNDPNYTVATTFWRTQDDADTCYSSQDYATLLSKLRPLFNSDVHPVFYNVEISTTQKIVQGKAA
jgi:heme-degrading monooxygenase HmoA